MSRKGFTPRGTVARASGVFEAGGGKAATMSDVGDAIRDVDSARREDALDIQRELQADAQDIATNATTITALQAAQCVAFARVAVVGGLVTTSQLGNLTVTSVGTALTLKFAVVPAQYAVTVTRGSGTVLVVYEVDARADDFDVLQYDLTGTPVTFVEADQETHINVCGVL